MQKAEDDVRSALAALYPKLKRFAFTLTGSPDAADDLVQITCELALAQASQWNPAIPLMTWLFAVMNDTWESEQRLQLSSESAGRSANHDYENGTAVEDHLMLNDVCRKLLELPEEQQSVLTLVGLRGFSYKETAEALGIRPGTVMSRLFRGRNALARLINSPRRRSVAGQDI
jgi:RNA polymerase sigma-70 factor (ECF subfamily)